MAKDDPESSTAEDTAIGQWGQAVDDGTIIAAMWPWRERAFREGFRAGREHGLRMANSNRWSEVVREQMSPNPRQTPQQIADTTLPRPGSASFNAVYERGWAAAMHEVERRELNRASVSVAAERFQRQGGAAVAEMRVAAPADSPLGVELSKIRDRLNALEQRPEPDHRGRFMGIERQIEQLGTHCGESRRRIEALENHPERLGSSEKHIDRRVDAVEKDWVQTAVLVSELQAKVARLERCTVGLEPIG